MSASQNLLQLIIAYTLVGAFVFTVVVTCLSLIGVIRFADSKQQKQLFTALLLQMITGSVGFFFNWLTFDPREVTASIKQEAVSEREISKAAGLENFWPRANDFLPRMGELIRSAKKEIWLTGVSFYITVPEQKDVLIEKVKEGVKVRFLVFDIFSPDVQEVAHGFSQSLAALESECKTTMIGLLEIRQALEGNRHAKNFEVRLYSDVPKARFYIFDRQDASGKTFFVPHVNGINSPNLPAFLFTNRTGSLASIYFPSVEDLWQHAQSLEQWEIKHHDWVKEL